MPHLSTQLLWMPRLLAYNRIRTQRNKTREYCYRPRRFKPLQCFWSQPCKAASGGLSQIVRPADQITPKTFNQALHDAEKRIEEYAANMIATAEEAMKEVEGAKETFSAELERVSQEKREVEARLAEAQSDAVQLAV